ncbi:MAG: hypothetical protein ACE5I2_09160 [Anaerolineae bacterium]
MREGDSGIALPALPRHCLPALPAKVLAEFAPTVRDEADLDKLTAELQRVVEETMQPEFVSLWLSEIPARGISRNRP